MELAGEASWAPSWAVSKARPPLVRKLGARAGSQGEQFDMDGANSAQKTPPAVLQTVHVGIEEGRGALLVYARLVDASRNSILCI